eukprot:GHVU01138976.1.p3 GENE.GHVU01138976.1~~GHVU01138976.1.p3  ORF type:complete len:161 (+),score=24.40 GHVU01138976.1:310-792(+)
MRDEGYCRTAKAAFEGRRHTRTHAVCGQPDRQVGREAGERTCNVPCRTDDSPVIAGTDLRCVRVSSTRGVDVDGGPDLNIPGPEGEEEAEGEEEVEAEGEGEEVEMKWVCDFGSIDRWMPIGADEELPEPPLVRSAALRGTGTQPAMDAGGNIHMRRMDG